MPTKPSTYIAFVLIILFAVAIHGLFDSCRNTAYAYAHEGFVSSSLHPGEYPKSVVDPLLTPEYPKKAVNYGVVFRENDSAKAATLHPKNQNKSPGEWATPDNGTCTPASFCNALYDPKPDVSNGSVAIATATTSDMWPPHKRVNMYASAPFGSETA